MNIKLSTKRMLSRLIKVLYKMTYKYIPTNNKIVLFVSYHGKGYLCNPKYLHKYMSMNEKYKEFKYVWAVKNYKDTNIENAKVVRYNGLLYFYYLARSKYWIINCKMPKHVLKKENQIYIQTWHGTPLKRLAHDIDIGKNATFYRSKMSKSEMTETYDNDVKKYNYFISPNVFATDKFKSSFKIKQEIIIESGYPRNDFLTNITRREINELRYKYNIPKDKKVILYAPTWRDNSFTSKGYTFELKVDFNFWKSKLGDEYIVIFKPHYLIINKYNNEDLNGFLYTVNENEDINELYVISDILVTDYSSVFFDYAILRRPIYFYMYDLKEYEENLRGFYLDINNDLPGDVIINESDLLEAILDNKNYLMKNYNKFIRFNNIYNQLQDGECCKRVVDKIIV